MVRYEINFLNTYSMIIKKPRKKIFFRGFFVSKETKMIYNRLERKTEKMPSKWPFQTKSIHFKSL